jgi:hypothetical protein
MMTWKEKVIQNNGMENDYQTNYFRVRFSCKYAALRVDGIYEILSVGVSNFIKPKIEEKLESQSKDEE